MIYLYLNELSWHKSFKFRIKNTLFYPWSETKGNVLSSVSTRGTTFTCLTITDHFLLGDGGDFRLNDVPRGSVCSLKFRKSLEKGNTAKKEKKEWLNISTSPTRDVMLYLYIFLIVLRISQFYSCFWYLWLVYEIRRLRILVSEIKLVFVHKHLP